MSPSRPEPRQPCWYCKHYIGPAHGDPDLASCNADAPAGRVRSQAEFGCSQYERVPGVDDDLWRPAPKVRAPLERPDADILARRMARRVPLAEQHRRPESAVARRPVMDHPWTVEKMFPYFAINED